MGFGNTPYFCLDVGYPTVPVSLAYPIPDSRLGLDTRFITIFTMLAEMGLATIKDSLLYLRNPIIPVSLACSKLSLRSVFDTQFVTSFYNFQISRL
ncbi:hypothetical protein NPIL_656021 [Nephila pilipes]|uniref:Uncharacterized protein n=1 Tax=Nephila pilipes TaxID=299642 RepID=A0A8X6PN01_NEPPI|nr:hypothetical protein NPIL_656021 [Nephila pilipes]